MILKPLKVLTLNLSPRTSNLPFVVGAPRFELGTPCAQGRCATRLRYAPTFFLYHEEEIGDKDRCVPCGL